MSEPRETKSYWLDDPRNVTKIFYGLLAVCAISVAVEPFFLPDHPHYAFERWVGFYGAFGFVAFFLIVLAGKPLRRLVGRKEDYYDH